MTLTYLWWTVKGFLGLASVKDGSACWFSSKYYDVHDFYISKGGDGTPSHFYDYTCGMCGKVFSI